MAEEIINYLDTTLSEPNRVAFYGCQDYLRAAGTDKRLQPGLPGAETLQYFSLIDDWVYTDANAQTAAAYLAASAVVARPDCRVRALRLLDFLWDRCRESEGGMVHYFDGSPQVAGLLMDQVHTGLALLKAHEVSADGRYLDRAKELAQYVMGRFKNPDGGYYDRCVSGPARLRFPLTLMEQNGVAARFFLKLAERTKERTYRLAAIWALSAFTEDFTPYGIHAAGFGRALSEFIHSSGR